MKLGLILVLLAGLCPAQDLREHWIATWGTSHQLIRGTVRPSGNRPRVAITPPAAQPGVPQRRFPIPPRIETIANQTVRMIVRTSVGGKSIRVRLSNAVGASTVLVGAAHIAMRAKDSAIVADSDHVLTFSGNPSANLGAGQVLVSDPVQMDVPALSELAISLFLPKDTGPPATHLFGLHTTYISKDGDWTAKPSIADARFSESYYWLAGVDVLAPADAGTVVAFGDSITDGDQSAPNTNGTWPAVLAERLHANRATARIGVVNAGISGNRLLGDGTSGLARLYRDALDQPGVKWLMLLEGINDIAAATREPVSSGRTADDLIAAYRQVIEAAHLHGIKVIGCTLTPFGASGAYRERGEAIRQTVNAWVRTSGMFDAVVDFDAATRDATDPHRFKPDVDSPDLLHPGNTGYKLMAETVDLRIFADTRRAQAPLDPGLPSVFVAGDSTAAEGNPNAVGWGRTVAALFDPARVNVVNRARGGRSSRTFVAEGLWDRLLADVKTGDYVLIQFGHNDGGPVNGERIARGSLPGLGEESQEIENRVTKQHETVHTFGWYTRKMIRETKAKGAMPIVLSLTVRNIWKDGHVERGSGNFSQWNREIAEKEGVAFIDLTNMVADQYEQMGQEAVKLLFPRDHTHTSQAGAELNARFVVAGLKALRENTLIRALSPEGRVIDTARPAAIFAAQLPVPRGGNLEFFRWLNLPLPADPKLPCLFLTGDSTVRNGRGDGVNGQWGWGDPLAAYFDPAKINVVNRAVGGTGSRTFIDIGHWDRVMTMLKPGDIVMMQFGHNDNGPGGPLRGVGEEAEVRDNPATGEKDTVHTFGWYLRKYVTDVRARGAVPIICTLVPRNMWEGSRVARPKDSHADWAREVARQQGVDLIDLYEKIAQAYDEMGQARVMELFADKRVHTTRAGAELNARIVIDTARALQKNPLAPYLRKDPAPIW